jgi:glycosyltransferase involved in cell wall biosynthesis
MKQLKVSLVVSDLSGGGAIRAFLLGQVLRKLDLAVEVVGCQFGPALYAIPPQTIPVTAVIGQPYPGFLGSAAKVLKKIDGDIIYAVKPKPSSLGLALLKKLQSRRPVIIDMDDWEMSWYGGDEWKYQPSFRKLYHDLFKPYGELRSPDHPLYVKWTEGLVRFADAVTIDTEFLQQRFGGVYIPNGKDTELFNPSQYDAQLSKAKYGLSPYTVLMFPGAPRPHKGVEDVLAALEQLQRPELRVVIVGGSPYDDYDERLMQRWGQWLIKLPKQPVETMPEVLAAADIMVVPQKDTLTARAQFPLKLTDGMAMAKPVLATRVGDIPQILGDTGYLVEPSAPAQIAEAILTILANPAAAHKRGLQARQRCIEQCSLDTMATSLAAVIAKLIGDQTVKKGIA